MLYEQKRRRLKRFEERGADGRKVGPTEVNIRKLSTKIKVAIQVVDSISNRINQLRDEELWPQLVELIHGYDTLSVISLFSRSIFLNFVYIFLQHGDHVEEHDGLPSESVQRHRRIRKHGRRLLRSSS